MGHDIYARRVNQAEQDRLHDEFSEASRGKTSAEWLELYDKYSGKVNVAYLRRSAFDPMRRVIYDALDAGELYGGCSGIGESRSFTREQIETALESIPGCALADPSERNLAHVLLDSLSAANADNVVRGGEDNSDPTPEYEFLRTVLAWMDATGTGSVSIHFG